DRLRVPPARPVRLQGQRQTIPATFLQGLQLRRKPKQCYGSYEGDMPQRSDLYTLPDDLPVPTDDGACDHLVGMVLSSIPLSATDGQQIDLAALRGRTVVYVYPRTGRPDYPGSAAWDAIPGARGCTPQSCGFRDHYAELRSLGASAIFGLSTQTTDYQREAVERLHLPFPLLSDSGLVFTRALRLPTFEFQTY